MRPKVFICEPNASSKGCHANSLTQNLALGLSRHAEVFLFSAKKFYEPMYEGLGIHYHSLDILPSIGLNVRRRYLQVFNSIICLLIGRLKGFSIYPDLIVWPNGFGFVAVLTSCLFPGIPVYLFLHSSIVKSYEKSWVIFRLYRTLEKCSLKRLARRHRLLVHSMQVRDELEKDHQIIVSKDEVIPVGINLYPIEINRLRKSAILIFGGVHSNKNYECAIRGFLAQKSFRKMVIAGVVLDPSIPNLLTALDVEKRIVLIDRYITEVELKSFYDEADLALLPHGANYHGLSGTLSRALEFGVPMVAPDQEEIASLFRRFDLGLIYQAGNSGSLCARLEEAAKNYSDLYEQFIKSRITMGKDYQWEEIGRRVVRLSGILISKNIPVKTK